jgi:hypothetical protein
MLGSLDGTLIYPSTTFGIRTTAPSFRPRPPPKRPPIIDFTPGPGYYDAPHLDVESKRSRTHEVRGRPSHSSY